MTVTPAPDRTVHVDGVDLAVDVRGSGEQALVLVHGFTGGRVDFADVIDDLAADRVVVAHDHRGHADSTNTGDAASYTLDQLAQDLAGLVEHLDLERFDLLGHSMGGLVVMRYARAHPERVRSLVLMDTLAGPADIPLGWVDGVVGVGRDQGMAAVADLLTGFPQLLETVPEERRDVVQARMRHKLSSMDVEALAALGAELCSFEPVHAGLVDLGVPITVLVGEHDPLRAAADVLAEDLGSSEGPVVIAGAAHSPQDEARDAWLAAVRAHLVAAAG